MRLFAGILYLIWAFTPLTVAWSLIFPFDSPFNPFSVGHVLIFVYTFGTFSLVTLCVLAKHADQFRWDIALWALANAFIVYTTTVLLLVGYYKTTI
jgi:hypothetical protein